MKNHCNNRRDVRVSVVLTVDMDGAESLGMTLEDVLEGFVIDADPFLDQHVLSLAGDERVDPDRDCLLLNARIESAEALASDGRTATTAKRLREEYPAGTRVELVKMNDAQAPPIGTKGTVTGVDDTASLLVKWDNGCGLNVIYDEDIVNKVDAAEASK